MQDKKIPAPFEVVMAARWCVSQYDISPSRIRFTDYASKEMLKEKPPVDLEEILEALFNGDHYYNTEFWKEERGDWINVQETKYGSIILPYVIKWNEETGYPERIIIITVYRQKRR